MTENPFYRYKDAALNCSHDYLLPTVKKLLTTISQSDSDKSMFELGCGNGSIANELHALGYDIIGVDPSPEGISHANRMYPHLQLHEGSAYDDLAGQYGTFPMVVSLEVVEHVYYPRQYAQTLFKLLAHGGHAIISTPYHGYWKNLALAVSGRMDSHFTALWDGGHIKFWSIATLSRLLAETGFDVLSFSRVGRISPLAKSMVCLARKP